MYQDLEILNKSKFFLFLALEIKFDIESLNNLDSYIFSMKPSYLETFTDKEYLLIAPGS